jgi:hypothetical protein
MLWMLSAFRFRRNAIANSQGIHSEAFLTLASIIIRYPDQETTARKMLMRSNVCALGDGSPPLTLILIDSNPFVRGFARGRFGYSAARRLRTQLKALSQEKFEALRQSTTIAVLHHHPIPVPHEGSDFFLVLQNAETLIQLIAEMDINIVLHGHKHRATFSSLSSSKFRNPNL